VLLLLPLRLLAAVAERLGVSRGALPSERLGDVGGAKSAPPPAT